jgi:stearoyl-CoA desaturase (delta-9 desaturase)
MSKAVADQRFVYSVNWVSIVWILGFHVGALLAFVPAFFTWQAVAVALFLHWLTISVGISMTYHRLLTHRSFAVRPRWLEYPMTVIASCAAQGDAIGMVSDHRRHHAHTDEDFDTHSPTRGLLRAHFTWWMVKEERELHTPSYYMRWAPDLYKDPVHRLLSRYHWAFPVLLCAGLYAVGGMPWLVWGGFVRTVLGIHTAWSVNSAGHTWGYRNYATKDRSRNNWWVALLTYGEGWHNNHHAVQTAAQIGERWWEIDPTFEAIRLLQALGLAQRIRPRGVGRSHLAPAGVAVGPTDESPVVEASA